MKMRITGWTQLPAKESKTKHALAMLAYVKYQPVLAPEDSKHEKMMKTMVTIQ